MTSIASPLASAPSLGDAQEDAPLDTAKQGLSSALKALTRRDYTLAEELAEQAEMDAAAAERLAASADRRHEAHEVQAAAHVLRQQIDQIDTLLFDHRPH